MFDYLPRPASSARPLPQASDMPAWLSPATAQAIRTTIDQLLTSGADAEAARAAAAAVAWGRHPALPMVLITEAVLDLFPPG